MDGAEVELADRGLVVTVDESIPIGRRLDGTPDVRNDSSCRSCNQRDLGVLAILPMTFQPNRPLHYE